MNVAVVVVTHGTYDAFVIPLMSLSFHGAAGGVVSADRGLPMLFFVPLPVAFVDSVIGTAYVVFTSVALSVLIFVKVFCNINSGNVMSAFSCMPMFFFVGCPS